MGDNLFTSLQRTERLKRDGNTKSLRGREKNRRDSDGKVETAITQRGHREVLKSESEIGDNQLFCSLLLNIF